MSAKPRVSIGLPVFNGERFLLEAIESIQSQTLQDFELLISDNASTDATWEICRQCAENDSRIRLHRNEINLGAIRNFEMVLSMAQADYFMWDAHDDLLTPSYVERCWNFLESHPDFVLCCARTTIIDEWGSELQSPLTDYHLDSDQVTDRCAKCLGNLGILFDAVYGLIRKDFLLSLGEETRRGGELVIVFSAALEGKMAQLPEVLRYYRYHPSQISYQTRSREDRWRALLGHDYKIPLMPWTRAASRLTKAIVKTDHRIIEKIVLIMTVLQNVTRGKRLISDLPNAVAVLSSQNAVLHRFLKRIWHVLTRRASHTNAQSRE